VVTLVAALLIATAPTPSPVPSSTPFPIPTVPPAWTQPVDVVDLEAGGSNSYLNEHEEKWETAYAEADFAAPSGFKLNFIAQNNVAFGESNASYALTTDVPTHVPNGILDAGYIYSPGNHVFPTVAWLIGYDLRTGGGYGYEFGYFDRSYSTASASNYAIGMDRQFRHQRLAYFASFATLSTRSGVGVVQGLRWSTDLPTDSVVVVTSAGRGIEATGRNTVAMHDLFGFDAADLHWLDARTAIRVDAGYFSVWGSYQRFFALVGLRVRL